MKKTLLTIALVIAPFMASANDTSYSKTELVEIIKAHTHVSALQAANIVYAMEQNSSTPLEVTGFIHTSGFNFGLGVDSDEWRPTINLKDTSTGAQTSTNDFVMKYQNGGFKVELCYKWVLLFLTGSETTETLNGAVYGRGVALNFDPGVGVELGLALGKNRASNIFIVSPKIGAAAGVQFPKLTFKKQ